MSPIDRISSVTGRRQSIALRAVTILALVFAGLGSLLPKDWSSTPGAIAVWLMVVTPLARVVWLALRWGHEKDWRFVWVGAGLLGVILTGVFVAIGGSGP